MSDGLKKKRRDFEIMDITWKLCSQYQWLGLCKHCFCKPLKAEKEIFCSHREKKIDVVQIFLRKKVFFTSASTFFECQAVKH